MTDRNNQADCGPLIARGCGHSHIGNRTRPARRRVARWSFAGVGAETPEVALRVGGAETARTVVLIAHLAHDARARLRGAFVEGVRVVAHQIQRGRARGTLPE